MSPEPPAPPPDPPFPGAEDSAIPPPPPPFAIIGVGVPGPKIVSPPTVDAPPPVPIVIE